MRTCFNPQPPRRTAATLVIKLDLHVPIGFQSSAAPKDGCYDRRWVDLDDFLKFQSSAAPKDGCYQVLQRQLFITSEVSILSRPEGRLLLSTGGQVVPIVGFQSSAAPKDGCYVSGATASTITLDWVSILSRPEGRLLRGVISKPRSAVACFNPQPPRRTAATNYNAFRRA